MNRPVYKRIILKISGEVLAGDQPFGIDAKMIDYIAGEIAEVAAMGVEVAIVIGGGNIFRGISVCCNQIRLKARSNSANAIAHFERLGCDRCSTDDGVHWLLPALPDTVDELVSVVPVHTGQRIRPDHKLDIASDGTAGRILFEWAQHFEIVQTFRSAGTPPDKLGPKLLD